MVMPACCIEKQFSLVEDPFFRGEMRFCRRGTSLRALDASSTNARRSAHVALARRAFLAAEHRGDEVLALPDARVDHAADVHAGQREQRPCEPEMDGLHGLVAEVAVSGVEPSGERET